MAGLGLPQAPTDYKVEATRQRRDGRHHRVNLRNNGNSDLGDDDCGAGEKWMMCLEDIWRTNSTGLAAGGGEGEGKDVTDNPPDSVDGEARYRIKNEPLAFWL